MASPEDLGQNFLFRKTSVLSYFYENGKVLQPRQHGEWSNSLSRETGWRGVIEQPQCAGCLDGASCRATWTSSFHKPID